MHAPLRLLRSTRLAAVPLALACALTACSSSRPRDAGLRVEAPRPAVDVNHAAYETFDAAPYAETAAPAAADVQHDVPAALLAGNAAPEPAPSTPSAPSRPSTGPPVPRPTTLRTLSGYRVQVFQSTSKDEADRRVADAIAWWRRTQTGTPEVYTLYRAPYYRVRVGNYTNRGEASRVSGSLSGQFPNALIVQDRVTVRQ